MKLKKIANGQYEYKKYLIFKDTKSKWIFTNLNQGPYYTSKTLKNAINQINYIKK